MLDVVRPEFVPIKKKICVHTLAKILTNNTADFVRKIFNIRPPIVKQDPSKELKYEANKSYALKDTEKVSLAMSMFRMAEQGVQQFYVAVISILFFFKKMQ